MSLRHEFLDVRRGANDKGDNMKPGAVDRSGICLTSEQTLS
jgi:hypothetical protein